MTPAETRVPLSPLDHVPPSNYVVLAYYLPLKKGVGAREAFSILQYGLRKTFVDWPWLSGRVHRMQSGWPGRKQQPGQLEIRYSPVDPHDDGASLHQLKFSQPNTDLTYSDLEEAGFPVDALPDEELFPAPFWADLDAGADVFVAQASFIPGVCILTMSICHSVSDGTGMVAILNRWASHCAGGDGESHRLGASAGGDSDRSLLDKIWAQEWNARPLDAIDPAAWHMVGLQPPVAKAAVDAAVPATPPPPIQVPGDQQQISSTFYMTLESFKALQRECTTAVSGNDAVCALIWRSVLKARTTARKPPASLDAIVSELVLTVDGRPEFSAALPPGYLGNVVLGSVPTASLSALAGPDNTRLGVAEVAKLIHDKSKTIHHENLLDAYAVLREVEDYGLIRLPFTSVEGSSMLITSLLMMPVDEVCFGGDSVFDNGGHVAACRPLMGGFNRLFRIALVLPRKNRGGIEFCISLYEDEMELLLEDEEFGRFAVQV